MKNEKELFLLRNEDIQNATQKEYRQYFCGNLKRPQILDFIYMDNLEIGTSRYATFTTDEPHYHQTTSDMIYILKGEFHILLLEDKKQITLKPGDFISIPAKTSYVSKAKAGTETLFVKKCHRNDKVKVTISEETKIWLSVEI